jgi:hypothetical protein
VATAAQAIDRIEEATGISASRAARFLRERDVSLWPQGSQGRGQEAHVEAHHLVNVVLALAAADPLTGAPEVVAELRDLVPLRDDTRAPELPGDTLGEALDLRVSSLAASEGRGSETPDWWQITLINGPQFHAKIFNPKWLTLRTYLPRRFAKIEDMRASLLQREATLTHGLILVLADLYGDTLEHRARLLAKPQTERRPSARKTAAHA